MVIPAALLEKILPRVQKPARYVGGEWNSVRHDWASRNVRVILSYPDVYEIGMSNLGLQILYDVLNREPGVLAERAYAPWPDLEARLREAGLPLFSLESRRGLAEFDFLGFNLAVELCYTNVLTMLDLAGIPLLAAERPGGSTLVIAGGTGAFNPEPMADFIDLFVVGEGEEAVIELVRTLRTCVADFGRERAGWSTEQRREFLRRAARLPGIYVPSFYQPRYQTDGRLAAIAPTEAGVPARVYRRSVVDFASLPIPTRPIVPHLDTIFDRAMVEIMRGCTRGCRFCQAGMIYRPTRERSRAQVQAGIEEIVRNTGYEEVSLVSLSSADYGAIEPLVDQLNECFRGRNLSVSLPSLRLDAFSVRLAQATQQNRSTGLTFAPEAGTDRLRGVINKGVTEADLLRAVDAAFGAGRHRLKLYFMVGLPTETMEDVAGIADLVQRVLAVGRRYHGGRTQVVAGVSTFVPKAHTPFQWFPQDQPELLGAKHQLLRQRLRGRGLELRWNDPGSTLVEAALSLGDRRMGGVLLEAWQRGARFDAWEEHFALARWQAAADARGTDLGFYAHRQKDASETLPWDHIDTGVVKPFLVREQRKALRAGFTPMCKDNGPCASCGLGCWVA